MSKFIKIPADVKLINVNSKELTGNSLSFRDFVCEDVAAHPLWGISINETRAFKDILDALDEAVDSGVLKLAGSVYPLLRQVVEKPEYRTITNGQEASLRGFRRWNGAGVIQLLPFLDAILNATDTAPVVESKVNGASEVAVKKDAPVVEAQA